MTRPRFSFRPNLRSEEHRRAWDALQAVPEGSRNAFLVQAILQSVRQETLEDSLRRVIREEFKAVPSQPVEQPEKDIPEQVLGFLGFPAGRRIARRHHTERSDPMRKEIYKVKCPKRIVFGDPMYFEEFKGAELKRLTVDYKTSKFFDAARLVLEENQMRNFPDNWSAG